jgi:hypothetical protein
MDGEIDCTERRTGPVLDTVITTVATLIFMASASASEHEWNTVGSDCSMSIGPCGPLPPRSVAIAVSLGAAAIAGTSMVYGFAKTNACRRANQELLVRKMWRPPAAPSSPPPSPVATPPALPSSDEGVPPLLTPLSRLPEPQCAGATTTMARPTRPPPRPSLSLRRAMPTRAV